MAKILSLLGGLLALAGAIGSLFLGLLGWYNVGTTFTSSIGGSAGTIIPSPLDILGLIPGVLVVLGGILCFIPKKATCAIGGFLILAGVIFFLVTLYLDAGDFGFFWGSSGHVGYGLMGSFVGGLLAFIGAFVGNE
ncbi:hypothetical protein NEF87_001516 [Candidatus Lokiarchaeum ossiferum]|uniref:Uncharacterized protein n=1 Tax=Candidatus Lokiarchaeum ossiferum TaxID=2951803 RepID=A0ABY6HP74_9ARCH|nr:hypothetical protein NEF87_001516 [Candidatus Lokiarchaeum sp. B-35]